MVPRVRVMMVTDRRQMESGQVLKVVRAAALAGLDDIQIREKDLRGRALLDLVREVRAAVQGTPVRIFVNSRVDVAAVSGADGVQLPEEGLPVALVKRAFSRLQIGASRHSVGGAVQAEAEGADFVVLGPVFATPGKEDHALGLDVFAEATRAVRIPVYAIGGIDLDRAVAVAAAGAAGVALLRPFLTPSAGAAVAALRAALS